MPSTVAAHPAHRPDEQVDPRLVDAVLAAAMAVVVAVVAAADPEGTGRAGSLCYLFAAGFGALLLARRHAPRLVLVLTVLGIFVYYMFQLPPIGIALPAVAALFSAAEADRTRAAAAAGAVLVSVAAYFRVHEGLPTSYLVSYDLLTDVALVAAAVALGVSVRSRRELRSTVKLLRSPGADPAERSSIGLAGIPQLATAAEDAGVEVTARIDVDPQELDATIDAAAYRLVQESLTNVLRHSGARHAAVQARLRNGTLELRVTDDGRGAPRAASPHAAPAAGDGGRGLQGMAERVVLLGGTLTTGNREGGGFEVRATLPRRLGP